MFVVVWCCARVQNRSRYKDKPDGFGILNKTDNGEVINSPEEVNNNFYKYFFGYSIVFVKKIREKTGRMTKYNRYKT